MTARKPRPVVRIVIECYPRQAPDADVMLAFRTWVKDAAEDVASFGDDYRRPRVVSVRKVRGAKR